MLITISGPPGGGKTTVATAIADAFDLEHVSGGDIFRSLADDRGYSLVEFNALAEEDDSIDRDLDRRLRETARDRDDLDHRVLAPAGGVHREVVDRAVLELDSVVLPVAALLRILPGLRLPAGGLGIHALAVGDPGRANVEGCVEPHPQVGVVAGHPPR